MFKFLLKLNWDLNSAISCNSETITLIHYVILEVRRLNGTGKKRPEPSSLLTQQDFVQGKFVD